jgi:hypothetical protein
VQHIAVTLTDYLLPNVMDGVRTLLVRTRSTGAREAQVRINSYHGLRAAAHAAKVCWRAATSN